MSDQYQIPAAALLPPTVTGDLRRRGMCIGTGCLFLLALNSAVSVVLAMVLLIIGTDVLTATQGTPYYIYMAIYAVAYAVMMGLPMLIATRLFRIPVKPLSAHRPLSFGRALLWLFFGLGLCLAANLVTDLWMDLLGSIGVPEPSLPFGGAVDLGGFAVNLAVFAILPAILEEAFFRGFILQMLKPFHRGAAVAISALLFGLMHGNVLQVPFAFMVGLALGLIYVRTENIWLCIGVHLLNNTLSEAISFVEKFLPGDVATINNLYNTTMIILGVIAVAAGILLIVTRDRSPKEWTLELSGGTVWKHAVFRAPTMIAAIIAFIGSILLSVATSYLQVWLQTLVK